MMDEVTYAQINGTLGSLLRLWSVIERQARAAVQSRDGSAKSCHGIAATLDLWQKVIVEDDDPGSLRPVLTRVLRTKLQPCLRTRNGLCHGLVAATAAQREQPASLTWDLNGTRNTMTWDELQSMFSWLSRVPRAMSMLERRPTLVLGCRLLINDENAQWWIREFDLDARMSA